MPDRRIQVSTLVRLPPGCGPKCTRGMLDEAWNACIGLLHSELGRMRVESHVVVPLGRRHGRRLYYVAVTAVTCSGRKARRVCPEPSRN